MSLNLSSCRQLSFMPRCPVQMLACQLYCVFEHINGYLVNSLCLAFNCHIGLRAKCDDLLLFVDPSQRLRYQSLTKTRRYVYQGQLHTSSTSRLIISGSEVIEQREREARCVALWINNYICEMYINITVAIVIIICWLLTVSKYKICHAYLPENYTYNFLVDSGCLKSS